jgi:hypothetical protein
MKLNKVVITLGVILIFAFAIRVYHLHDWLYFQADQVRNTNHAHEILEQGWEGVPLLGPKAGGTDFHLGPVSYYFEVVPALIFGLDHPATVVYSNLFFILLSIVLVYYFLRQGFSKNTSLQITTLYSFSYVVIQYSRFSWNPNSLLFWGLLFILGIYKIFQHNSKYRGWWLIIAALSYGVVSQLHTTALLGYPGVFIMYGLYKMLKGEKTLMAKNFSAFKDGTIKLVKSISWKYWVGALSILFIMYTPVIIYDIQNDWYNTKEFAKAFSGKTSSDKGVGEKLYREINLMGKYYSLNVFSLNRKEFSWGHHKDFWLVNWLGLGLLIGAGGVIGYFKMQKRKNEESVNIIEDDDFLILNFIWWLVFCILFFPLAYKLDQMRFWFIAFLIPYISLVIIFECLKMKNSGKVVVRVIVVLILVLNLSAVVNWYIGLEKQDGQNRLWRQPMTSTLQQSDWVTYEKMKEAVDYMSKQSGERTSCFRTPSKNRASYRYIFEHSYPESKGRVLRGKIIASDLEKCEVYLIKHSKKTTLDIIANYKKDGKIIELGQLQKFGVITIWQVNSLR